jgi:hypothetical protein
MQLREGLLQKLRHIKSADPDEFTLQTKLREGLGRGSIPTISRGKGEQKFERQSFCKCSKKKRYTVETRTQIES